MSSSSFTSPFFNPSLLSFLSIFFVKISIDLFSAPFFIASLMIWSFDSSVSSFSLTFSTAQSFIPFPTIFSTFFLFFTVFSFSFFSLFFSFLFFFKQLSPPASVLAATSCIALSRLLLFLLLRNRLKCHRDIHYARHVYLI